MRQLASLDEMVRVRLKKWPQHPPGLDIQRRMRRSWLRGRPTEGTGACNPFLKLPGSTHLRTLPDGLWLNFGGDSVEPFVDIFAVEACGSLQNLLDKRSRFAPSIHSLLAVCPLAWLLAPVAPGLDQPRWRATGVLAAPPVAPLVLPVRDIRVMYGLKTRHYEGFLESGLPQAHEYFVPMETLTAENGDRDPRLLALLARASAAANFLAPA